MVYVFTLCTAPRLIFSTDRMKKEAIINEKIKNEINRVISKTNIVH